MSKPTILRVEVLSKNFGGLKAVNKVSFDVREGELIGLIGPNGSGKTTMLNLISGALKPSGGAIQLDGENIAGKSAHIIARKGVARTFQLVRILPTLTIRENVIAGAVFGHASHWGDDADRQAEELLQKVGLADHADLPTASLTYIDQKRLELARALASNPRILLLDEWLAGLNPSELQIGISLIRDLSNEGRTIIMVEHVMDAIRSLCDRCVVMSSGVKIADGGVDDVLSQPDVISAYLGGDDD
ncbi:MAG: ABC transporter ATP-binding protein [Hyphomicrobiales bacterium]|nr:ABC transporter ATP-binding protein [Hyphomicrobiales bacterium]PCJ90490.1 MAG: ABC transporter ATP-binding protein [Hyphomicrobiales bacterium]